MHRLEKPFVEGLCKGKGGTDTCSYLGVGGEGFCCLKMSEFEAMIDGRRAKQGMRAMGNHCTGLPNFTPTIMFGVDSLVRAEN